jgi:hypothetical protein
MIELEQVKLEWVVPEKIHTPPTEEISAVRRGRGEKIVSDNSKCIRTSEGGRGVNFLFPPWGWYGCFWNDPMCLSLLCYFKLFINARIFSRQGESIGLGI